MTDEITVCIPTIPGREKMLRRALGSVLLQSVPAAAIAVVRDVNREGVPPVRDRALRMARTEWVAFLDDDDQFLPEHLETLLVVALTQGADYVFSWYQIIGPDGVTPFPGDVLPHFGKQWDPENPTQTTITTLVRTELAQSIGFREPPEGATINGERYGEDFQFTIECAAAGAKILHVPRKTWLWHHHGKNTSGRPIG